MTLTLDDAERVVAERLGGPALGHSKRVADTAAELARIYGVDAEAAALAGLLHDWDRELEGPQLMRRAGEFGLSISDSDREVPYLLHARTAVADLRSVLPDVPDGVLRAVERHTTGAVDMSDLDRVVFIADMIEPQRSYPGVEALREAVGEVSVSELFLRAYAHSIRSLVERRKHIHPIAVHVWNAALAEVKPSDV